MQHKAYQAQCAAEEDRHTAATTPIRHRRLVLFALALGTFAIGTGAFGSNGIIQLIDTGLVHSRPVAVGGEPSTARPESCQAPHPVVRLSRRERQVPALHGRWTHVWSHCHQPLHGLMPRPAMSRGRPSGSREGRWHRVGTDQSAGTGSAWTGPLRDRLRCATRGATGQGMTEVPRRGKSVPTWRRSPTSSCRRRR